ncbi:MAG: DUF4271 domain-containing protein [Prevotellaceae bacterium]|nr:DUF4271 domain-containing protein [Prevotellaceae bacterium]
MLDSVKNSFPLLSSLDSMEVHPGAVYGSRTHLVASRAAGDGIGQLRPNVAFFDFNFSVSLLLLIFLSVCFLIFRKNFSTFPDTFLYFRKFWNYRRVQGWSSFLFFVFLFLFAVFSLALFFAEVLHYSVPALAESASFLSLFVALCGIVTGFLLLRFFICWIVGVVSSEERLFSDIIHSQALFFAAMGFAIVPLILVKNFCSEPVGGNIFVLLYVLLSLIACLYFFRTIRLFIQENNSIFFWILYFCTVEILPIMVAIKFLGGF